VLDHTRLRVELARRDLTQTALALRMGVPQSTLSMWLTGVHPAPTDLTQRIEMALDLARGVLAVREHRRTT